MHAAWVTPVSVSNTVTALTWLIDELEAKRGVVMDATAAPMRVFGDLVSHVVQQKLPLDTSAAANLLWGMSVARISHPSLAARLLSLVTQHSATVAGLQHQTSTKGIERPTGTTEGGVKGTIAEEGRVYGSSNPTDHDPDSRTDSLPSSCPI